MKVKTITLSYPHANPSAGHNARYRVEKVTDSVGYDPGQYLLKSEVADLCDNRRWKVTVIAPK